MVFYHGNRRVTKAPPHFPSKKMNPRNSWAQKNVRTCMVLALSELTSTTATMTIDSHEGL